MIGPREVDRRWATVAIFAPLPLVAGALALHWPWWPPLLPMGVVVALAAEFTGMFAGLMSAMVGTVGMSLIIERADHPTHPRNGLELGAMAVLLLVVAVSGTNRTIE